MNRRILIAAAMCGIAVAACEKTEGTDGPLGANDPTPIRDVICSNDGTYCFVAARFKNMDGCWSHDKWASMLCDSVSKPGQMICEDDKRKRESPVSYCIP